MSYYGQAWVERLHLDNLRPSSASTFTCSICHRHHEIVGRKLLPDDGQVRVKRYRCAVCVRAGVAS